MLTKGSTSLKKTFLGVAAIIIKIIYFNFKPISEHCLFFRIRCTVKIQIEQVYIYIAVPKTKVIFNYFLFSTAICIFICVNYHVRLELKMPSEPRRNQSQKCCNSNKCQMKIVSFQLPWAIKIYIYIYIMEEGVVVMRIFPSKSLSKCQRGIQEPLKIKKYIGRIS